MAEMQRCPREAVWGLGDCHKDSEVILKAKGTAGRFFTTAGGGGHDLPLVWAGPPEWIAGARAEAGRARETK